MDYFKEKKHKKIIRDLSKQKEIAELEDAIAYHKARVQHGASFESKINEPSINIANELRGGIKDVGDVVSDVIKEQRETKIKGIERVVDRVGDNVVQVAEKLKPLYPFLGTAAVIGAAGGLVKPIAHLSGYQEK